MDSGAVRSNAAGNEIIINANTGETSLYPAYQMILAFSGVLVYLRVPGELGVTFKGDFESIIRVLSRLKIPFNPSVLQHA